MINSTIPRKWEFIADKLRELDAPKKVINAAVEIDTAMVKLGLGYNTRSWIQLNLNLISYNLNTVNLFRLIHDQSSCSACFDCGGICLHCKLGVNGKCTPRQKHADNYFLIVSHWVLMARK